MGRPVQAINQIVAGTKAITPQTARELQAVFPSTSAVEWLRLEAAFRLSINPGLAEVKLIERRMKLHDRAPVREMVQRKWICRTKDIDALEAEVVRFYGVKSVEKIEPLKYCARSNADLSLVHDAWVRQAKILAEGLSTKRYSKKQLQSVLPSIKEALSNPARVGEIPHLLANAGVRVVFIEHLPKTRIDGAAFWIGGRKSKCSIAMSLRFGRIDYFAFTLMHEIAHILHEHEPSIDTELTGSHLELPPEELIANKWAAEYLLPPDQLKRLLISTGNSPSKEAIRGFANSMGVHPGVVLGQLQHRGIVAYSSHRNLLVDVRDGLLSSRKQLVEAGVAAFDGFKDLAKEGD